MDWSLEEVMRIVADYFDMLHNELSHIKYNKSQHRRDLQPLLNGRTYGSIEFKHQNISAALAKMGAPYIKGYKPMPNLQGILEEEVLRFIRERGTSFEPLFQQFADETPPAIVVDNLRFKDIEGEIPVALELEKPKRTYRAFKTNFLEREQNNSRLGEDGERLVLQYEKLRLQRMGKSNLINKIQWVSKDKGDGLGYDILSKNVDGSDRFIEVKTTKLSNETPFFVSGLEIDFAFEHADSFFLYRVYNFGTAPKIFILEGEYSSFCSLEPISYRCRVTKKINNQ